MKRLACIISVLALCLALVGCESPLAGDGASADDNPTPGVESPEGDKGGTGDDAPATNPYASGTHHARAYIVGYGQVEIEIYADSAPQTAATFCRLVEEGYYNCTHVDTVMKSLYVGIAGNEGKEAEDIPGEYAEAGYDGNRLSLTAGVIAMGRDGDGTTSDPSELIVFLGNTSYLDGQYAGFAKVTRGIKVMQAISDAVEGDGATAATGGAAGTIKVKKDGTVKKKTRPLVRKVELID